MESVVGSLKYSSTRQMSLTDLGTLPRYATLSYVIVIIAAVQGWKRYDFSGIHYKLTNQKHLQQHTRQETF